MPQPTVFRSIPKSDVQVTRFNAYKNWIVTNADATASGYIPLNAIFYDTRPSTKYDPTADAASGWSNIVYRESGTPGTEYGRTRAFYHIKPIDLPSLDYFYYGIVPFSYPGSSVTNVEGNETGALNGYFQIPGSITPNAPRGIGNQTVPAVNYHIPGAKLAHMPPSGSGVNNFQYWKFTIWDSLYHNFYKRPYDPAACLQSNQADPNAMHKYLSHSASMLSIPQNKMGHGIKPKSIEISSTRFPFTLTDDKYGNIRIPNDYINTGSFAPNNNLVAYWGFNELTRQSRQGYHNGNWEGWNKHTTTEIQSGQFAPSFQSSGSHIAFKPGINTTGEIQPSGLAAHFGTFPKNSPEEAPCLMKTGNFIGINPEKDFAWSAWINVANTNQRTLTPADTDRDIISKYGVETRWAGKYIGPSYQDFINDYRDLLYHGTATDHSGTATEGYADTEYAIAQANDSNWTHGINEFQIKRNRYPYRLGVYDQTHTSAGHVYVRRSNGVKMVDFSSSVDLRGTDSHIMLQKTGSLIELWVNGTLDNSGSDVGGNCNNKSDILFGSSNRAGGNSYSGSLDEVRYYDTALTTTQIGSLSNNHYLSGSAYQTNVVGNVFRSFGFAVTSSPMWFWNDLFTQEYNWTLKYKSSLAIEEHNVLVNVPQGHFNVTQNPSGLQGIYTDRLLGDFTSSLTPYVSTIGLYDDIGHLLAVGKLSNPIQKRNDVDMNFVIRWDM